MKSLHQPYRRQPVHSMRLCRFLLVWVSVFALAGATHSGQVGEKGKPPKPPSPTLPPKPEPLPNPKRAPKSKPRPPASRAPVSNGSPALQSLMNANSYVRIQPGEFLMGSNSGNEVEKPVRQVRITREFEMGKYEVTQAQWEAVMGNNPSYFKGPNLPVETVSWDDVQDFLHALNRKDSRYIYRLPTEAEWEYACRAGTTGDYAGDLDAMAWYRGNSGRTTHPVGQKQPNAWGLYDMHGTVWEWCQDWFGPYSASDVVDPQGPSSGSRRVLRGGSWDHLAAGCRSASRNGGTPGFHFHYLGFRPVRTLR